MMHGIILTKENVLNNFSNFKIELNESNSIITVLNFFL